MDATCLKHCHIIGIDFVLKLIPIHTKNKERCFKKIIINTKYSTF